MMLIRLASFLSVSALSLVGGAPLARAAEPAPILPVEGNVGLITTPIGNAAFRPGVEAELGYVGFPLRVGALTWSPLFGTGYAGTLWGGYAFRMRERDRLTLLAGATHYAQGGVGCYDTCATPSTGGAFVGVSYTFREERLWLSITPQYFAPIGQSYYPPWALSGLPWAELGVPVTDHLTISLRLGETLLKAAYTL